MLLSPSKLLEIPVSKLVSQFCLLSRFEKIVLACCLSLISVCLLITLHLWQYIGLVFEVVKWDLASHFPIQDPVPQPEKFIEIVGSDKKTHTELFAFSKNACEASVKIVVKGSNVCLEPPEPAWRGISRDSRDPLVIIRPRNQRLPYSYTTNYDYHVGTVGGTPNLKHMYQLPYKTGSQFMVTQGYSGHSHVAGGPCEYAIDFGMPENTVVCAARSGLVIAIRDDSTAGGDDAKYSSSGNYVIIKHSDGSSALYGHLAPNSSVVKIQESVPCGKPIAKAGNTGFSNGNHLHFQVSYYDVHHRQISVPVLFRSAEGIFVDPRSGDFRTCI